MKPGMSALIKKDIGSITSNRQAFAVLLITPLTLTVVLPSVFALVTVFAPAAA